MQLRARVCPLGVGLAAGCGDDGLLDDDPQAGDDFCETAQRRDTLRAASDLLQDDLWRWHEPDVADKEAAWAARVWRPLELLAGL